MEDKNKKPEMLYQIIYDATRDKFATLPMLAGLILALVTFGVSSGLFVLTDNIRYVTTILLLLMMLAIQVYYSENSSLLIEAQKKFDEHFKRPTSNHSLNFTQSIKYLITGKINNEIKQKDFFNRFSSQFPALAILILWFVVFFIIYQIWSSKIS